MKIKIDTKIMQDPRVEQMLEIEGIPGFGTLIALKLELAKRPEQQCTLKQLKIVGKRLGMKPKTLRSTVCNYGLFDIKELDNGEVLISVCERTCGDTSAGDGPAMPPHVGAHVAACVEEKKEMMSIPDGHTREIQKIPNWEKYIDQAAEDMIWLETVAMNNYLPIKDRLPEMMAIFKRHVRAQANENQIGNVKEAKRYFANYARAGKPTYKRLMEELRAVRHGGQVSMRPGGKVPHPSCHAGGKMPMRVGYEDIDPETGERSYCGIPIPAEAPPRPNEYAVYLNDQWVV